MKSWNNPEITIMEVEKTELGNSNPLNPDMHYHENQDVTWWSAS